MTSASSDNMMTTNTTGLSRNVTIGASGCLVLQPQEFIPWNNPDNIISFHTQQLVRNMKNLVFLPITFLIGIPANVINMAVFYKHGLKERINVCLFALSLADGLYLLTSLVGHGEKFYLHFTTKEIFGPFMRWIINHNLFGFFGFRWVSQILTAIVASERCFCVLQPLKSQTVFRTSTMTIVIVVVFIVVMGLRFLVATRYYVGCAYDPVSDSIKLVGSIGEFYGKHKKLVDFLDTVVYGMGIPWVVIVEVLTATAITALKLRQAAEQRAGMASISSSVSARDVSLTWMLVWNSVFFIVCAFPIGLFRVALLFIPDLNLGRRYHNMFVVGLWLSNIVFSINATFNIVVYYTMGSRYRQTFWSLLRRKRAKDTYSKTSRTTEKPMAIVK